MAVPKTEAIGIRVTATDREAWERAAEADGRSLSAWIIRRCNGESTTAPVFGARETPRPRRRAR